jgi:hypothetical protein
MAPSSRDRLSVDLNGLKAALFARAEALGVTPSGLVRKTLAEALGAPDQGDNSRAMPSPVSGSGPRARLCLRMSREHARATLQAAQRAGMHPGDYIGSLVANVPVVSAGGSRAGHIAALVATSAELSALSRDIRRLTALLRRADVEPARPYRAMLDTLAGDVRRHLDVCAQALADLRPLGRSTGPSTPSTR